MLVVTCEGESGDTGTYEVYFYICIGDVTTLVDTTDGEVTVFVPSVGRSELVLAETEAIGCIIADAVEDQ